MSAALSATVNEVLLTNVVGRAELFHSATEFDSNPVPISVIVAATPGGTYCGEIEVIEGIGLFTLKVRTADVPPPGVGLCIVIWLAELPLRSAAGTVAFSSVVLINVVVNDVPFHASTDADTKPDPTTSSGVSLAPATTLLGLTFVTAGAGLFTEKSTAADVPPPGGGFTTVKVATVAFARLLGARVMLKLVAELYVVAMGVPFHCAVEEDMNPDPAIITGVSREPATIEDGVTAVMEGTGFEAGSGFVEAGDPPPQPVMKNIDDRTEGRRARGAACVRDSNDLRCSMATSVSRI